MEKLKLLNEKNETLEASIKKAIDNNYSDAASISLAKTKLAEGQSIAKIVGESKGEINPLGQVLLSKIIEIRLHVESEIVKNEPDLLKYDQAIKNLLANTPSGFQNKFKPEYFSKSGIEEAAAKGFKLEDAPFYLPVKDVQEAIDAVMTALQEAITASSLISSQSFFSECSLSERIGNGQLTVSPSEQLGLTKGTGYVIQVIVSGGKPSYQVEKSVLPEHVSTSLDEATNRLTVTVTKDAAAGKVVIPIKDSQSAVTNFIIELK